MATKYGLKAISKLADKFLKGDEEAVWFSAPSRSIRAVVQVYRKLGVPMSNREAMDHICKAIKKLSLKDFSESKLQWDMTVDIYGMEYDGVNWFIKFCIEDDCLNEISFHPLERLLKLQSGEVLEVNYAY